MTQPHQTSQSVQPALQPFRDLSTTMVKLLNSEVGAMLLLCLAFVAFMSIFGNQRKGKLAQGRFGGRWEKWSAVRIGQRQLQQQKHNQVTVWAGTPVIKGALAEAKTVLLDSPPTLHLAHAQQGIIVCGAPNSGKTYGIIDPCIRSAIQQGIPCIVYDYKGDVRFVG